LDPAYTGRTDGCNSLFRKTKAQYRMRVLLFSAILYLVGVVIILFLKPNFMFQEDGSWKEFGISNTTKYTWFPVWLFCIVWALVSYAIVKFTIDLPTVVATVTAAATAIPTIKKNLKPGYYVLNKEKLEDEGVPRYIYIGEEAPE